MTQVICPQFYVILHPLILPTSPHFSNFANFICCLSASLLPVWSSASASLPITLKSLGKSAKTWFSQLRDQACLCSCWLEAGLFLINCKPLRPSFPLTPLPDVQPPLFDCITSAASAAAIDSCLLLLPICPFLHALLLCQCSCLARVTNIEAALLLSVNLTRPSTLVTTTLPPGSTYSRHSALWSNPTSLQSSPSVIFFFL